MKVNLKSLSVAELKSLQSEIAVEIELRVREERQSLVNEIREKAKALGVTLEELLAGQKARGRSGKAVAKYVHPGDPGLTWAGRGKRPRWVGEWLASGKSLDELKV